MSLEGVPEQERGAAQPPLLRRDRRKVGGGESSPSGARARRSRCQKMLVRVFTLKFDPVVGGFDDGPLRDFVKDKEVLSLRDHFFIREEAPHLAVVVTYNLLRPEESTAPTPQEGRDENREKWRAFLEEGDWPLFNTLRDWRNQQAREEGIPPYVICTNRQLAQIARARPSSLGKLATIEGLGKAKIERYGGLILQLVGPAPEPDKGKEDNVGGE